MFRGLSLKEFRIPADIMIPGGDFILMEMRSRKKYFLFPVILLVFALAGCGLFTKNYGFNSDTEGLYVQKDGQILSTLTSDFDQSYYDIEELTYVAQQQVQKFNSDNYGQSYYSYNQLTDEQKKQMILPVALNSVTQSGETVKVVLQFGNGDIYTAFSAIDIAAAGGTKVYTSTVGATEVALSGNFVTPSGAAADTAKIMEDTEDTLVYVDYAVQISTERDIAYVSDGVTMVNSHTVQTPAGQGSFVIFK